MQLALDIPAPAPTPASVVRDIVRLHQGTPSFRSVDRAVSKTTRSGIEITADVTMFDGQPAKLQVWRSADEWTGHRWLSLPGGHCELVDGRWRRVEQEAS